jgi:HSP20 family protein
MALPVRVERGHLFDPFDIVRNDLNVLGRLLGISDSNDGGSSLASLSNYGVDIREDADHIYVDADLPGFSKQDIDISLENGMLTITAERQELVEQPAPGQAGQQPGQAAQPGQEQQAGQHQRPDNGQPQQQQSQQRQQEQSYLLRERRIRRFVRSFNLPPNVDESSVQAKLENGVLRITLNKREESKAKRIEVS